MCCLMCHQHYISWERVEVDPMKTAAVQEWPTPHTVKDIWVFLGWHPTTEATFQFCFSRYASHRFDEKGGQTHVGR